MQVVHFYHRNNDCSYQDAMRPKGGVSAFGGINSSDVAADSLPNSNQRADLPVNQAPGLEDKNDDHRINPDNGDFDGIAVHQTVAYGEYHHGYKENAHTHLYKAAVKAQRQEHWYDETKLQVEIGIGLP